MAQEEEEQKNELNQTLYLQFGGESYAFEYRKGITGYDLFLFLSSALKIEPIKSPLELRALASIWLINTVSESDSRELYLPLSQISPKTTLPSSVELRFDPKIFRLSEGETEEAETTTTSSSTGTTGTTGKEVEHELDEVQYENEAYYGQYARYEIHCSMLRDHHRCRTYREAVDQFSEERFRGKAVLDVGCGSGVLSCLAARAGARVVYAVEASGMAEKARLVVARNGFEHVVHVINSTMESAPIPEQVDVIISEWMGCFLLFEGMLESVIYARDRYLKPDGAMFPRFANMYMAPISYAEFWQANVDFLPSVEGVDFGCLVPSIREHFTEAAFKSMVLPAEFLIADGQLIRRIDTRTISAADLTGIFTVKFNYTVQQRHECANPPVLPYLQPSQLWKTGDPLFFHGFVLWFDCLFSDVDFSPDRFLPTVFPPSSSSPASLSPIFSSPLTSYSTSTSNSTSTLSSSSSSTSSSTITSSSSSSTTTSTSEAPKGVVLTTRPGSRTHWEQDVCLFPDYSPCKVGETISGILRIKRNEDWKRHYDLEFSFSVNQQQIYKYFSL